MQCMGITLGRWQNGKRAGYPLYSGVGVVLQLETCVMTAVVTFP